MKTLCTRCLAAMAGVVMTIALAACGGEDSASTATQAQPASVQADANAKKPADTLHCAP
ncbi:hypothetical protein [Cupriavidus necator]|uniref:hypothetical protein n=1 Tax=Cupriavidus necator TaxID=106590 RepID=UPI0013E02092|nr:hypothetical protein [Cupriavidus necator]